MDGPWRIQLLGWVRAQQGERVVARFRTQKVRSLFSFLAYHRDRGHPRDELIELLWPEAGIDDGRNNLRQALWSLRRQLEPPGVPAGRVLVADRSTVRLDAQATTTDVAELEAALAAAGRLLAGATRARALAAAVEIYRGDLVPGDYFDWVAGPRERLRAAYFRALHDLVADLERERDPARALEYARRAASADPLSEAARRDLMRVLAASGQAAEAVRQYRDLERALARDVGTAPSPATRDLARDIERRCALPARSPSPSPLPAPSPSPSPAPTPAPPSSSPTPVPPPPSPSPSPDSAPVPLRAPLPSSARIVTVVAIEADSAAAPDPGATLDAAAAALAARGGRELRAPAGVRAFAFSRPGKALDAALAIAAPSPAPAPVPPPAPAVGPPALRLGLATGELATASPSSPSPEPLVEHAARLATAAHAGQVICAEETEMFLRPSLAAALELSDLGAFHLVGPSPDGARPPGRLFEARGKGDARRFPPPRVAPVRRSRLPLELSRFFGREDELARLLAGLPPTGAARLVTITGLGGAGKTRLAVEAARRLEDGFRGGVHFVPLAGLAQASSIPGAILDALGGRDRPAAPGAAPAAPAGDPLDAAATALGREPALAVLDGFDALVQDGIPVLRALLERAPALACLVTARRRLGLAGEVEVRLAPLATPVEALDPERLVLVPSVRLFVDRAQAVRPDFQVTHANAAAVAELCHRLDGLPLALELAAARAQVLAPAQMLARLADRFDLLVDRRREVPGRHRTLRAAIDASADLLAPEVARLLARLSVFRDGFTLEDAEAVCEDDATLDRLTELRESSLVVAEGDGPELRFRLLGTIRAYAAERLPAADRARLERRHAERCLALAEQADAALGGPEQGAWLARLAAGHGNLRAALAWALAPEAPEGGDLPDAILHPTRIARIHMALRLAGALATFWWRRGHVIEGRGWLEQALARAPAPTPARARALRGASELAWWEGDYERSRRCADEALEIQRAVGDRAGAAASLRRLGSIAHVTGDLRAARSAYERSAGLLRAIGDRAGLAVTLNNLGHAAYIEADFEASRALYVEAGEIFEETKNRRALAQIRYNLASLDLAGGDPGAARAGLEAARAAYADLGEEPAVATTFMRLATLEEGLGNAGAAVDLATRAVEIYEARGLKPFIAAALHGLASARLAAGDIAGAASAIGRCLALNLELESEGDLATARHVEGAILHARGDLTGARRALVEALGRMHELSGVVFVPAAIDDLARVEADAGDAGDPVSAARAARLLGAAEAMRRRLKMPRSARQDGLARAALARAAQTLGRAPAEREAAAGRALDYEGAIALAVGRGA